MKKKIVLVTSGQPSANPRLIKEATALSGAGYEVKVIYCPLSAWADRFDLDLFNRYPAITWKKVGFHAREQKTLYLFSRARKKFYQWLYQLFGNRFGAAIKSTSLFSQELCKEVVKHQADLYIGHNLASLPAVIKAASQNGKKVCFDFEDFHRGEGIMGSQHWNKTRIIEDYYVPKLHAATAASPLIAATYKNLYSVNPVVINNVFSSKFLVKEVKPVSHPVKLFWFSQIVGRQRGLEELILALTQLPSHAFELTLLGCCSNEMKKYLEETGKRYDGSKVQINFLDPVHPDEIFKIATQHDIGLAVEPGRDGNNRIALSNKLFTYLLAGNAIIFSATPAQELFFNQNLCIGSIYKCGDINALVSILKIYIDEPGLIITQKNSSLLLAAEKYNWEKEQQLLLNCIQSLLN